MANDIDTESPGGWSPARTELLHLHYDLGLSASVSALLIGDTSRNAVISKRRRLGLYGANPLRSARAAVGRASNHRSDLFGCRLPALGSMNQRAERGEALPFMDWPPPTDANPKTLAARSPGECAWPLGPAQAPGDYRTLFCSAPVTAGRVYCAAHHARAFIVEPASSCEGEGADV